MAHDSPPDAAHLDDDMCLDLVLGLLGGAERTRALLHASNCAACESRVRAAAATHERGRARAAGTLASTARTSRPRWWRVPSWSGWLAAAGLIAVSGITLWTLGASRTKAFQEWPAPPLPAVDARRIVADRSGTESDSVVWRGILAYENGRPEEARRLLQAATADAGMEVLRRSYLASAQLVLNDAAEAVATLEWIHHTDVPEPWRSEVEWLRIVANERSGHHERADSLVEARLYDSPLIRERVARLRAGQSLTP